MPITELQDRTIIVVVRVKFEIITQLGPNILRPSQQANLKPANMRGVKSFAMVLCVRSPA